MFVVCLVELSGLEEKVHMYAYSVVCPQAPGMMLHPRQELGSRRGGQERPNRTRVTEMNLI